jgi:hypothetical protein
LEQLGEQASDALFLEFVQRLFETGQSQRAREEIGQRRSAMSSKLGVQLAWVCHHVQAYDMSCDLFLASLRENNANYKYLNALESAAKKCNRVEEVIKAYHALAPELHHFYGRIKALGKN